MSFNNITAGQLNPALLQAMAQAQAQNGPNSGGGNAAFHTFHQAFQRLQSQESQKADQQRLGVGVPQQHHPMQNGGPSQAAQQQFLQMMQQVGTGNGQTGGGINFANIMAAQNQSQGQNQSGQAQQVMNQGQVQGQGQMNLGDLAVQMGGMGQNNFNIHSQQQGLSLPGMPDNEQGRRQMLQNMLSQQLQSLPSGQQQVRPQFQQPQQQGQQISQQPNPMPNVGPNLGPPPGTTAAQLREFIKNNPDVLMQIQQRHPDNNQAVMTELAQVLHDAQNNGFANLSQANQQTSQQNLRQPSFNLDPSQLPANYLNTQQPQSQMGQSMNPQASQQRMPSADQFQNFQAMQNQMNGIGSIDPKQMEALQAMKAAQQRGGLVTPQMQANNLPMVSPQAQMSMSQPQQNANFGQGTPHIEAGQLNLPSTSAAPNPGVQNTAPFHQRTMSQSSAQPGPSVPRPHLGNSGADVQNMIQSWGDNQLLRSTIAVVGKLTETKSTGNSDPTKFYLLQIIAEWKRRNKEPPMAALQTAGQALGNPQMISQLAATDWSSLAEFAKGRVDAAASNGADAAAREALGRLVNGNGPGTQSNPIDVMTPTVSGTPQLGSQSQLGSAAYSTTPQSNVALQSPAQITQKNQQQQQLSRETLQQMNQQQSQNQQNQGANPQRFLPQQSRPPLPASSSAQSVAQTTRPWLSMDFRNEPIPLKEEQLWASLAAKHGTRQEPFVPPVIEGRPVNMFHLFSLVHRNGGSANIANNSVMWTHIGGYLGFGTEAPQGQPQRCSLLVANQLRALYAQYIQPLEDLFYSRLYKEKMHAASAQGTTPPEQAKPANQPIGAQGMSSQFLEAVSKVPGALSDKQKKTLEEARRLSASSYAALQQQQSAEAGPSSGVNPSQTTPQNVPTPNTPKAPQMAQLANNPVMLLQWIKAREDMMKAKFPKDFKVPSDEEKPRFLAELRAIIPQAKEAQERAPKFLLVANNEREVSTVTNLISMYMFIFVAVQYAEAGRYPFTIDELAKLRDPLNRVFLRLSTAYKQLMSTQEGQARYQKLISNLEAVQAGMSSSMPPPSTVPEDIASKLPKGLRVEDLKPPPAKRQKGSVSKSSPAQSGNAATPEAKTPVGNADSPAGSSSAQKKGASGGNKRKRQPSASQTPSQTAADVKVDMAKLQLPAPGPAKDNMLGINLDTAEAETQDSKAFFAAYNVLRPDAVRKENDTTSAAVAGTEEIWSSLIAAVDEYHADPRNHSTTANVISNALSMPSLENKLASVSSELPVKTSTANLLSIDHDDELFAQFIDITQVDDNSAWTQPTPELLRVYSRDDDNDTSPESVKTVGSTTCFNLKTPITTHNLKIDEDSIAVLGGTESPQNNAYNGSIFGGWEDSTFNFVSAA